MKLFEATVLAMALAVTFAVAGNAAEPAYTTPANPPQIATNPGLPYSSARTPGPKAGPSNWLPSSPSTAAPSTTAPNPDADTAGSYYSGKSFGPKPN
jgi:hypothetical protein